MVAHALREDRAVTCGLVITEIMQGARHEKEKKTLWEHFSLLRCLELTREDYREAASMGSDLRRKGVIIKTVDLLIAHLAIREKLSLLHDDSDFKLIARHFSLLLV